MRLALYVAGGLVAAYGTAIVGLIVGIGVAVALDKEDES